MKPICAKGSSMNRLDIKFSPEALSELTAITNFLMTEADPHHARRQMERLKRAINQLRAFPDLGPLSVSSLGPYRQWFVAGYVVFYISDDTKLSVLRIISENHVPGMYLAAKTAPVA
jgi:plasmid stabilization system protein ParE